MTNVSLESVLAGATGYLGNDWYWRLRDELAELRRRDEWLGYLEAAGIDNTDAYGEAQMARAADERADQE